MFVKPAPGLVVRDPVTKFPLPAEGREVQLSSYWQRRLNSGDVVAIPSPAPLTLGSVALFPASDKDPYHYDSDEVKP